MDRAALWSALEAHPTTGWRAPRSVALPPVPPSCRLLWCGIGGSLLPAETLLRALGDAGARSRWTPLASPEPLALDLRPDDQVVFASKSGRTLELWTWIARLRGLPGWRALARRPLVITQDDDNPLARFARAEGWTLLPIPVDVGGRYSAFTPVGTLPLAWMGLDDEAFLQGGRDVVAQVKGGHGLWNDRVWELVEALHREYLHGIDVWVLLPYHLRLEALTAWWVQLVAESLGKVAKDGTRRGIVPLRAVGPIDQHSQLQLWMEGPRRLGVAALTVKTQAAPERMDVPEACPYPGLSELQGADILAAQAEGTLEALREAGLPVLRWDLEAPTPRSLGELMMAWQLAVGLTGFALELDPFDQPGVEDGKRRTFRRLGLA
jgi:glucose-6-phosphate isomerase